MSGLLGALSIAASALAAQQTALEITSNNIANVDTDAYARQIPKLVEDIPVLIGGLMIGTGVQVEGIETLRDDVLELRLHEETQRQGQLRGYINSMQQVDSSFSNVDSGIGALISKFFGSLSSLSTQPQDLSLRKNVLTAANNLAAGIRASASSLQALENSLDDGISQSISEVNGLTSQIASLNGEISRQKNVGADTSELQDQRTEAIRSLSNLIDVELVETDAGTTVTTANGTALVVGEHCSPLETSPNPSAHVDILSQGSDITERVSGGSIAGMLRARDEGVQSALDGLNTLASGLASSLNGVHKEGFDLNGEPGSNLFADPLPLNTAVNFHVVLVDPAQLAASSDGDKGDGGNCLAMMNLQSEAVITNEDPMSFFAGLTEKVGNDVQGAQTEIDVSDAILKQLEDQRGAISGVSLDEEAANLIRYQRAFEASAKVVTVIDELAQTILSMGGN